MQIQSENVTARAECTHEELVYPDFIYGGEQTGEQICAVCGYIVAKAEGPDYSTL
jgi:rubrerythrin